MTNRCKLLFFNVFFLALGAGCQSLPTPGEGPDSFVLRGKVAVAERGERFTANILWQQSAQDFRIDLWGPLGQGRVRLVKRGAEVRLESGAGDLLAQGAAERVMEDHLGWSLPVAVLPAWVQGRPLETVAAQDVRYDDAGRVTQFRQLGWTVMLDRYQTLPDEASDGGERALPKRVKAASDRSDLRLVIAAWEI